MSFNRRDHLSYLITINDNLELLAANIENYKINASAKDAINASAAYIEKVSRYIVEIMTPAVYEKTVGKEIAEMEEKAHPQALKLPLVFAGFNFFKREGYKTIEKALSDELGLQKVATELRELVTKIHALKSGMSTAEASFKLLEDPKEIANKIRHIASSLKPKIDELSNDIRAEMNEALKQKALMITAMNGPKK